MTKKTQNIQVKPFSPQDGQTLILEEENPSEEIPNNLIPDGT